MRGWLGLVWLGLVWLGFVWYGFWFRVRRGGGVGGVFRSSFRRFVGNRAWVRLVFLAVGEEALEGAVVGSGVADLVAVEEVEDVALVGVVDQGVEGEGVGVDFDDESGDSGSGVGDGPGEFLLDDDGKAGGFHAEGAGAAPHGDDHGVDGVALMLVDGFEVFIQVGREFDEGFGALGFHYGEVGEEAVAVGVARGVRFALLGDGAFGFGTVGAGCGYLGCAAGSAGFGWCGFVGMGQVFHRAAIVAGVGVENEPWGMENGVVEGGFWLWNVRLAGNFGLVKIVVIGVADLGSIR